MVASGAIYSALAMWAWLLSQKLWLLFVAFGLAVMASALRRAEL